MVYYRAMIYYWHMVYSHTDGLTMEVLSQIPIIDFGIHVKFVYMIFLSGKETRLLEEPVG